MRKIILLFCLLVLVSCKTTKKSNLDLYMSGYTNEDFNVPADFFLGFKNDSVFLFDSKGAYYSVFKQPKNSKDSVELSETKISLSKTKDFVKYESFKEVEKQWEGYFFSLKGKKNVDSERFQNLVNNKSFETQIPKTSSSPNSDLKIIKKMSFGDKKVTITYFYYYNNHLMYSEFEIAPYKTIQINQNLFIQIENSKKNRNRIYEVIKLKSNQFTLVHYAETKTVYEKYKAVKSSIENPKKYQTCTDYRPYEYYNFNAERRYSKGHKHLLNKINKDAPLTKGNGYITIHFTLNCKDEIGRFGLEQMDMNYHATSFDQELIKHLISQISKIEDWNSKAKKDEDVHTFLMFKIENGKIIDLCP